MLTFLRRFFARRLTHNIVQQERNSVAILESWSNVPMGCCDCGLIHRYDFWVNSKGHLCVRARRDPELTAAIRTVRHFPMRRDRDVPTNDVHPANVRVADDQRDRMLHFRDRLEDERLRRAALVKDQEEGYVPEAAPHHGEVTPRTR